MTIIEQTTAITTRHNERHTQNDLNLTFGRLSGAKQHLDIILLKLSSLSDQYNLIRTIVSQEICTDLDESVNMRRNEFNNMLNTCFQEIDNIQTHNIKSSFDGFTGTIDPLITLHWELHKQTLNISLISEEDINLYKEIKKNDDFNILATEIIALQKSVKDKVKICPPNLVGYMQITKQINQLESLLNQLYNYFPDYIRVFLEKLKPGKEASLDDFTTKVRNWFEEKGLMNTLCIKSRQQNG